MVRVRGQGKYLDEGRGNHGKFLDEGRSGRGRYFDEGRSDRGDTWTTGGVDLRRYLEGKAGARGIVVEFR